MVSFGCAHLGRTLGFNFDTGHAWACKEIFI